MNPELHFKWADDAREFEQIHRLNYETFVEEIPQHSPSAGRILVDRFHAENRYAICLKGSELVGMVALRGTRPFSLDGKLPDLDAYLPEGKPCEIRLLAVRRVHRSARILPGLLALVVQRAQEDGYDHAVISGTVRQIKLYEHLGFERFGSLVGSEPALFQPMRLGWDSFQRRLRASRLELLPAPPPSLFLPGPVGISPHVRAAFQGDPLSHRSALVRQELAETQKLLCALTNAHAATLLMGSGTLANEAVAAQLSLLPGRGLILVNGEFGRRLVDHARRWPLSFDVLEKPWGSRFQSSEIDHALARDPNIKWLWAVHCETSTGVMQDLEALKARCVPRGIRLCLDSISSLGTVPVDLRGVALATGVSGKGFGAYPGLSIVFQSEPLPDGGSLPRYIDLRLYEEKRYMPFTLSSNLLHALRAALTQPPPDRRQTEGDARRIRQELCRLGYEVITPASGASPAVITFTPPKGVSARRVGLGMERAGYRLAFESEYLSERNWLQMCLMGYYPRGEIDPALRRLAVLVSPNPIAPLPAEAAGSR